MSRKLPVRKPLGTASSKDDSQFSEALKLYDSKQYKKSLKVLDTTLKKSSQHGPSLALKGLCLHYCDPSDITSITTSKSEAESYIIRATTKEPKHHIVNHIAGIYYRAVKNYKEAAKWYAASMENGSPNKTILRDLAAMQSQIGDFSNLPSTRLAYLEDQPGYRANWTGAGTAHHLNGDFAAAEKVLSRIEDLLQDKLQEGDSYEHSELMLYKNQIIGESGDYERALEGIKKLEDDDTCFDGLAILEAKAFYLTQLGQLKEASKVYRQLLRRNPDNVEYYYNLENCLGTSNASPSVRAALYDKLATFYPKSDPPKFIPLTFLSGEEFEIRAETYLTTQLQRGVPSTFVNVKPLYKSKEKVNSIFNIVDNFFYGDAKEDPLTFCWTAYFLAQHFYHIKDYTYALRIADLAIKHTPTLVEPYIVKARILKRLNELEKAVEVMEFARSLDLQDRFINSKTAKYYLRANMINKAIDTISVFTKNDDAPNGLKDLHTMQSLWFITESGESYFRQYKNLLSQYKELSSKAELSEEEAEQLSTLQKDVSINLGLAYKRFQSVIVTYNEFHDDQLDFHQYCMRKGTARSYMAMVAWGQELYDQGMYVRSVEGLGELIFDVLNNTEVFKKDGKQGSKKSKKDKKEEGKKREALIAYSAASTTEGDDIFAEHIIEKLVSAKKVKDTEKIDELLGYVSKMNNDHSKIAQVLNFKINYYLKKYVICLQALNKLVSLDAKDPRVGFMYLSLLQASKNEETQVPIRKILDLGLTKSFGKLVELNDNENLLIDELLKTYFTKDNFETAKSVIQSIRVNLSSKLVERLNSLQETLDPYRSNYLKYFNSY